MVATLVTSHVPVYSRKRQTQVSVVIIEVMETEELYGTFHVMKTGPRDMGNSTMGSVLT